MKNDVNLEALKKLIEAAKELDLPIDMVLSLATAYVLARRLHKAVVQAAAIAILKNLGVEIGEKVMDKKEEE